MVGTDVEGERFYMIPEVARILRVSDQSVRRWIKAGKLRATKPGKEYRIAHSNLEEFLRAREPRPKAGSRSSLEPSFNDLLAEERRTVEISAAAGGAGGASASLLVGVDEHFDAIVAELRGAGLGEEIERAALARLEETRDELRRLVGTA